MTPANDLRDLAAWADFTSKWLEEAAHSANDNPDPSHRTITFDARVFDQVVTGFRRLPEIIEDIADQVERRPALSVIAGGKR
jgi:hypothetical protein